MGWVKAKKAKEIENVEGIIISGEEDQYISYALIYTTNISLRYWRFENGRLAILSPDEALKNTILNLPQNN